MAGGSGTRFWPKSTSRRPKQLLAFEGLSTRTLLEQTLDRFDGWIMPAHRWIVTTSLLGESVRAQSGGAQVLAEPQGRNTAPCIYWAAREIGALDPEAVMMVMPSDHFMQDVPRFMATVRSAVEWASSTGDLVTLGISPTRPETGYGYLRTAGPIAGGPALKVEAFVEKPDLERARRFVADGQHLWNGGMFVWRVSSILAEFDRLMPEMRQAWESSGQDVSAAYPRMTATSSDFGIMEKASKVVTFPLDCGWDDLGSWTSVELLAQSQGRGCEWGVGLEGEVTAVDSRGLVVDVPNRRVAALGVEDLIIVETDTVLLVARKDRAQDIKKMVDAVRSERPDLA
jgi:mannose-1-phosphate guanylyltransferase